MMITVGQRIRTIREQKGLTQKYVAKASGINVALLQKYEYGIRNPKDDQLKKIAEALDVEPVSLRPPRIENKAELLYALREISDRFGTVVIENGGRSVYIELNQLQLISEGENNQPADDIKMAKIRRVNDGEDAIIESNINDEFSDRELVIKYSRALETVRLIVSDKVELIEECIRRKELKVAIEHTRTLCATVDSIVKRKTKER